MTDNHSRWNTKAKQILQTVGSAVGGSAAKGVADAAIKLVDISGISGILDEKRTMWSEFSDYVQEHTACLLSVVPDTTSQPFDLRRQIEQLQTAMNEIVAEASEYQKQTTIERLTSHKVEMEKIKSLRDKFDKAVNIFQFRTGVMEKMDVAKILDSVKDMSRLVPELAAKLEDMDSRWHGGPDAVHYLPYASGMSWDPEKICMPGTRTDILTEAWDWIRSGETAEGAEILWIVDVAGSGKSAIAHTICQQAKREGVLLSCFFFDRSHANKNNPDRVVTTLARDLAALDERIAAIMSDVLRAHPGVRSASITQQFEDLVLNPETMARYPRDRLYLIMFDGLDEGYNSSLLRIFSTNVSRLPGLFRFMVTSRPEQKIVQVFGHVPYIRERKLQLRQSPNQEDVALYISDRLLSVAQTHRSDIHWPHAAKRAKLIEKSEGLFLWASIVMNVLADCVDPDAELAAVLALPGSPNPEHAMDTLYSKVLESLPWKIDTYFAEGYRIYMGTILAAHEPLTCSALRHLHADLPRTHPAAVFGKLGALVTGFESDDEPVRLLHESLRDFIRRNDGSQFHVSQVAASKILALRCLNVLNDELSRRGDQMQPDWLEKPLDGPIPGILREQIRGGLYYACCHCIDHLVDVDHVTTEMHAAIQQFLSNNLLRWIRLCISLGKYQTLQKFGKWLQKRFPQVRSRSRFAGVLLSRPPSVPMESDTPAYVYNIALAETLECISRQLYVDGRRDEALLTAQDSAHILCYPSFLGIPSVEDQLGRTLITISKAQRAMGRVEEALEISQNAVETFLHLHSQDSTWRRSIWRFARRGNFSQVRVPRNRALPGNLVSHEVGLARSYEMLAAVWSDMGRRDEALRTIEEGVKLFRELVRKRPAAFEADLAKSLNNLSKCLVDLGRREEALTTIEEAMRLFRELAKKRPVGFEADLAGSLLNGSKFLSELGRGEEALTTIEEAVNLFRELAGKQPAAFEVYLARSLNNLSTCLVDMGRREAALTTIEEAVKLLRELARKQPATFEVDLARSLNNLSKCLADLGRREAAMTTIEEAVKLLRELAGKRPAAFEAVLAKSLPNLSRSLLDLGRREEALTTSEEAVQLYRKLENKQPAAFEAELALSLHTLSQSLSEVGSSEAAMATIEEAVELYRELARKQPAAFKSHLAESLNNLSSTLADLGRREAALTTIEEALQLYRELVRKRPVAFEANLPIVLHNMSRFLSDLGRRNAALTTLEEAVQLFRELAKTRPDTFAHLLADSVSLLSDILSDVGLRAAALTAIEEAVKLQREQAAQRPNVFNFYLASSLQGLSDRLSDVGQRETALTVIQEAVCLWREASTARPGSVNDKLAAALCKWSARLSCVERHEEALQTISESVYLCRTLVKNGPASCKSGLSKALNQLALCLLFRTEYQQALAAAQESAVLRRDLSQDYPLKFSPELAESLYTCSRCLSEVGRHTEARDTIEEALILLRPFAVELPAAFNGGLKKQLQHLAIVRVALGQVEESWDAAGEAEGLDVS